MLIRFGVANHKSIRDYQEISFVASSLKGGTSQTIEAPGLKQRLLPAALIYGANASGKSNVLDALSEIRRHVVDSFRKNEPNGKIARAPFALMESNDAPTTFEVDLLLADVRYTYGFDVGDRAFTRERLHAYPHGHRQVWFEREAEGPMRFGKGLKGANRAIEGFLRPNALFLSTAAQHGHAGLMPIQQFFSRQIATDLTIEVEASDLEPWLSAPLGEGLARFLRDADVGIERVYERMRPAEGTVFRIVDGRFVPTDEDASFPHRGFTHRGAGGAGFELDIEEESRGTLRMGSLALRANDALADGGLLVVDELDASLHTDLVLRLVSLFTDPQINTKGAQLLATTHDTNLLASDVLRRDQVWFTEKDREGATSLFPLTDFRTRREDNIERGYLDGRFGAVPYLAPLEAFARAHEDAADA